MQQGRIAATSWGFFSGISIARGSSKRRTAAPREKKWRSVQLDRPFSHAHGLVSIEYHYAAARHSDHPDPSEQRQTVRIHHADDHVTGERLARRALLTSSMLLLATSRSSSSAVLCWR